MVTAAEMCFPLETDNIEIATPLTTQATPSHAPPHLLPFWTIGLPLHSSCRFVVSGAVCRVMGNYWSWQHYLQSGRCVFSASSGPRLCSGPSLVFLLEGPWRNEWRGALWVKDWGQWKLTATASVSEQSGSSMSSAHTGSPLNLDALCAPRLYCSAVCVRRKKEFLQRPEFCCGSFYTRYQPCWAWHHTSP